MKIYIPTHLENLKVIEQLSDLIRGYSDHYTVSQGSFDYYYYYYTSDAVKRFISLCILPESLPEGQDYESVLGYLSKMFYSVKGTLKVFDYMRTYLGIPFTGDIIYTVEEIRFEISEVTTVDMSLYISCMKDFLDALLYYSDLESAINTLNLIITGKISNSISTGMISYKEYKVE